MFSNTLDSALKYLDAGDPGMALEILTELHSSTPKDPQVNYWLGVVFLNIGQSRQAIDHLTAAAKVAKKEAAVFLTLAEAYLADTRPEEALPHARKASVLDRNSEQVQRILGEIYSRLRRPVMARQAFEAALKLNPESAPAHLALSRLLVSTGDLSDAESHFQKAFELAPDDPAVLINARDFSGLSIRQDLLDKIDTVLNLPDAPLSGLDLARLAFTGGKLADDAGDTAKAFHYLAKHRSDYYGTYDADQEKTFFGTFETAFDRQFFEDRQDFALSSDRPVFIFGMPRSGTSLVESILSAHPRAAAAGELNFFEDQITALSGGNRQQAFFDAALALDKKTAQKIGRKYLALLETYGKKNARVTDKLPQNFEHLWLIALLFPNAHFCHVTRNPADTCVSIYMTPLSGRHSYNQSQQSLAHYYGLYRQVMRHWDRVLPVDIRTQSYEALVASPDTQRRALVDHVKLPWDDACSQHEKNDAQVFTFSMAQVRKPIYTGSVNRFEKYRDHIQPLLQGLEKLDD